MTTATWRFRRGIIMFHLTMPSGGTPVAAIARSAEVFLDHPRNIGAATGSRFLHPAHPEAPGIVTWNGMLFWSHLAEFTSLPNEPIEIIIFQVPHETASIALSVSRETRQRLEMQDQGPAVPPARSEPDELT